MSDDKFTINIGCTPLITICLLIFGFCMHVYKIGKLETRIQIIETQLQDAQLIMPKDAAKLKQLFNDRS